MIAFILAIVCAVLWGICAILDIVANNPPILFILHVILVFLWSYIAKQTWDLYL